MENESRMRNSLTGWKNVSSFTFVSTVKSKGFISGTIMIMVIVALIMLSLNFLPVILAGGNNSDSGISGPAGDAPGNIAAATKLTVYFDGAADRQLVDYLMPELSKLPGIGGATAATAPQNVIDLVHDSTDAEIYITIAEQHFGGVSLVVNHPKSAEILTDSLMSTIRDTVRQAYREHVYLSHGVSPGDLDAVQVSVYATSPVAGEKAASEIAAMVNSFVPIVVSLVLFMLIFMYGTMIGQSIAAEKSSRVMETLLVSVRPLAVIVGKIAGMIGVCVTQIVAFLLFGGIISVVTAPFGFLGEFANLSGGVIPPEANAALASPELMYAAEEIAGSFGSIGPFEIIMIVIIFVLGFLFYAVLAGLFGATVSKMEDFQQAIAPYSLIGVVGIYLSYIPSAFTVKDALESGIRSNAVELFSYYFPVSSPFALPSAILLGKMTGFEAVLSVLVLALFVVLMALVVSKVYELIIIHTGDRIKLNQLIGFMQGARKQR